MSNTANFSSKIKIGLIIGFNHLNNFGTVSIHPNVPMALQVCNCCLGLINNNVLFILKCPSFENKLHDNPSHYDLSVEFSVQKYDWSTYM